MAYIHTIVERFIGPRMSCCSELGNGEKEEGKKCMWWYRKIYKIYYKGKKITILYNPTCT